MSTFSYRDVDTHNEQMLANYLDKNFYSTSQFDNFQRITDKTQQILGKDIVVTSSKLNLNNAIIDEKNTAHYVNKDLPTFAFELSSFSKNNTEMEGWLTDPNKQTEYYLLVYPFAELVNPYFTPATFKKITKVKLLLVKRADILNYLNSKGYSQERLRTVNRTLRKSIKSEEDNKNLKEQSKKQNGFWFFKTLRLQEQPINVVIPRKTLEDIAILKAEV